MKVFILAGGSGTRLWPISRKRYPKQFIRIMDEERSLFQKTFERSLKLTGIEDIYVITNKEYRYLVMGEFEVLGYDYNKDNVLLEPVARNTLPAIYYGLNRINFEEDESVVVFPSDHFIEKNDEFVAKIKASENLTNDYIVTFGIRPDSPKIGYGYIAPGISLGNGYLVSEFKEKPNKETAVEYLSKNYLWNSGIFMFKSKIFANEVKKYRSDIPEAFDQYDSIDDVFSSIKGISVDHGILEKSDKVAVVPVDIGWNDLGSFDSFYQVFDKDEHNNISKEGSILIESKNNMIYSEDGKAVAIIGMEDVIIVDKKDALLVCKRDTSEKVKEVVNQLKSIGDSRVDYGTFDYRPWGFYEIIDEKKNSYKIKKITVLSGKRLSYQMHYHRSEHWIVVKGTAKVTIDGKISYVRSGESVFMKERQKHRLENPGEIPLEIIEIQMGSYIEEDDIVRFDDDFER